MSKNSQNGTLELLRLDQVPEIGQLAVNNNGVYNMPEDEDDCLKSYQYFGNTLVLPLVTCNEPAESGSKVLLNNGDIGIVSSVAKARIVVNVVKEGAITAKNIPIMNARRIIVDSCNFSDAHMSAIINRYMRNGDSVKIGLDDDGKVRLRGDLSAIINPATPNADIAIKKLSLIRSIIDSDNVSDTNKTLLIEYVLTDNLAEIQSLNASTISDPDIQALSRQAIKMLY